MPASWPGAGIDLRLMGIQNNPKIIAEVFTYRFNKDGKVFVFWQGKQIKILKDREAQTFMTKIAGLDQQGGQLLMAKLTGNFKRGNEKQYKVTKAGSGDGYG